MNGLQCLFCQNGGVVNQQFEENPWWSMWVKPRKTTRMLIEKNARYGFLWLCLIFGMTESLRAAQSMSLATHLPLWGNLLVCLVFAIPFGAISFYATALLVFWTGKLIKGKGSYKEILVSASWSNVTTTMSLCLYALTLLFLGNAFFYKQFNDAAFPFPLSITLIVIFAAEFILSVWRLVLFIKSLAEVQKISGWMALLNVLLAAFLASIIYGIVFFSLFLVMKA